MVDFFELNTLIQNYPDIQKMFSNIESEIKHFAKEKGNKRKISKKDFSEFYQKKKEPKITCGIITYNEERSIQRCIQSVINEVDEILIVDSFSSDKTLDIIKDEFPSCRIVSNKWDHSFSKQRNIIFDYAEGDWILFLDADEFIDKNEIGKLRLYLNNINILNEKNLLVSPTIIDHTGHRYYNNNRIVPNNGEFKYVHRVHEEIVNCFTDEKPKSFKINLKINHDGYSEEILNFKKKHDRNLKLIVKMIEEDPSNIKWKYYFSKSIIRNPSDNEYINQAENYLLTIINYEVNLDKKIYLGPSFSLICQLYLLQNRFIDLKKSLNQFKESFPTCSDIIYYETQLLTALYKAQINRNISIMKNNYLTNSNLHSFVNSNDDHLKLLICALKKQMTNYEDIQSIFSTIKNEEQKKEFITSLNIEINEISYLIDYLKKESET